MDKISLASVEQKAKDKEIYLKRKLGFVDMMGKCGTCNDAADNDV